MSTTGMKRRSENWEALRSLDEIVLVLLRQARVIEYPGVVMQSSVNSARFQARKSVAFGCQATPDEAWVFTGSLVRDPALKSTSN